ncbi:MAG: putative PEP-CTERM system TPR-repeat lipoprotein [Candidatus Accumulibacter adjunctus]|uniref:PEP-CTERM system TPR-repeat lipoprotein n=1 Tax=Candidatus Accumulibacter adjunctus TaxID=1454001 RepID=A0A011MHJ6_9PROT|nr:MAG: putative PEP-CTERM system TPR-repeat lipoprotein [Candidatus Accumulibacter adjunctus]
MHPILPRLLPATLPAMLLVLLFAFSAPSAVANELAEAQRLLQQGQAEQALAKVDAYVAGKSRELQGRFLKGLILMEMSRSDDAITVFTQISDDYPELPEPYNNLAVLYARQQQLERARMLLEMAIRTHPGYALARENLGDVLLRQASQSYDEALRLDPANKALQAKQARLRELKVAPSPGAIR